jgi:hypothetical protein
MRKQDSLSPHFPEGVKWNWDFLLWTGEMEVGLLGLEMKDTKVGIRKTHILL